MSIIGLTGNPGSGKTTIANLFRTRGAVIFDCDKAIHKFYKNKKNKIAKMVSKVFPEAVIKRSLSCTVLAEIVFSDFKKLAVLEKIIHPAVIADLIAWIKKNKNKQGIFIAEVPLLFEKNLKRYFDSVIFVYSKRSNAVERLKRKYPGSWRIMAKRITLFLPQKEKTAKSDFVINNSFSIKHLKKEIRKVWSCLEKTISSKKARG